MNYRLYVHLETDGGDKVRTRVVHPPYPPEIYDECNRVWEGRQDIVGFWRGFRARVSFYYKKGQRGMF